jgi:hypothetical protein
MKKYDILTKELGAAHNFKTRIIPYVLTLDEIVTKKSVLLNMIWQGGKLK